MSRANRLAKSPIYLTDLERDLVVSALAGLRDELSKSHGSSGWEAKLADSFTIKRINEVIGFFKDGNKKEPK